MPREATLREHGVSKTSLSKDDGPRNGAGADGTAAVS